MSKHSEYRTHLRRRYDHPDIVVMVSPGLGTGFEWIVSYFEEAVAGGTTFHENQLVQIGWMMVTLRLREHGDLEVWEPRCDSMPIRWVPGASTTIRHLVLQRALCRQLDMDPVFPALNQSGVVSARFIGTKAFCMEREVSQAGSDSGWIFKDPHPEGGRHCSLFEIAVSRPEVIPFLALPVGAAVTCDASGVTVSHRGHTLSSALNEFLAGLAR
ncbi:immunity protein Imm33 domain-containing protein [Ralstonia solanacearum]|uniref:immunity protein Imm33 domain-containing protein n=1 Tax=Ralstonia solanacearum TaxID=305 RepID=UPI001FF9EE6E